MIYEQFKKQFVLKENIRSLPGGRIQSPTYFLVTESDYVMRGKLWVQSATQAFPAFPNGFEPFVFPHGEERFCIATQTISVPRLCSYGSSKFGGIFVGHDRQQTGILRPIMGSEEWVFLSRCADRFDWQARIRRYVSSNKHDFDVVLDLLREGGSSGVVTSVPARVDLFERRIMLASDSTLASVARLLAIEKLSHHPLAA